MLLIRLTTNKTGESAGNLAGAFAMGVYINIEGEQLCR